MIADRHPKQFTHFGCDLHIISIPHCVLQSFAVPSCDMIVKPFQNCGLEDFSDFHIRNLQSHALSRVISFDFIFCLCQIPGQVKDTPQIFFGRMQVIIRQFLFDLLFNCSSCQKYFQLFCDCVPFLFNKRADNCIVACIFPVTCWFYIRIMLQIRKIIQNIPRTVHINRSKMISIVPFFYHPGFFRLSKLFQHVFNLILRKSEIFIESVV